MIFHFHHTYELNFNAHIIIFEKVILATQTISFGQQVIMLVSLMKEEVIHVRSGMMGVRTVSSKITHYVGKKANLIQELCSLMILTTRSI